MYPATIQQDAPSEQIPGRHTREVSYSRGPRESICSTLCHSGRFNRGYDGGVDVVGLNKAGVMS